jgi:hypothetical protein
MGGGGGGRWGIARVSNVQLLGLLIFLCDLAFHVLGLSASATDSSTHITATSMDSPKANVKLYIDGPSMGTCEITDGGSATTIYQWTVHRLFSTFNDGGLTVYWGCGVVTANVTNQSLKFVLKNQNRASTTAAPTGGSE